VFALSYAASRRLQGRPPWLLAVALAVTVPGCLLSACSAPSGSPHDRTPAASRPPTAADGRASPASRHSSALAVSLLSQAARAAIATSYRGQEIVSRWGNSGETVLTSDIWHVSGGQTVTQTVAAGTYSSGPYLSSDTDGQAPEGVLGVTMPLVRLLEAHYTVVYAGPGTVVGDNNRPAQVVEAWRDDGTLAARFWLDDATKLPLEREVFDPAAHLISEDVFFNVHFGNPAPVHPQAGGVADPQGPWTDPLSPGQLLELRAHGWLVPGGLPGGLLLFAGAQTQTSNGTALDLGYSDGLSVVSVFEQRGDLAAGLSGWQKTTVDGHVIYAAVPDQRSLTWSSRGMVYTVMADAPTQTVYAAVGALPHDSPPGFWKRLSRGFARLASWVNPFR
jgi:sigma-E factor negative regulatory protein RseB